MCANSLVNTAASIYQYLLGLKIMKKARERGMKTVIRAPWPQELPLFFIMKDFRHRYVWQQWGVLGKLRQNMNGGFVIIFDKGPVLPVQRMLCFQFLQGQTQVTLKASVAPKSTRQPKLQKSKFVEATLNKHHHLPYAVNYIKCRLCDAYTIPYSSCLKCPLTSQDLVSSPVPVNYTKWCVRHWFHQSTVVASNPIITCLLVQ